MAAIESVIFDWGGVLIDNPTPGLMEHCASAFGIKLEDYVKVHSKFEPDFDKGLISEEQFWEDVCGELGVAGPTAESLWGQAFSSVYSPRQNMFEMAKQLRQGGYKIGLLSNTERPHMEYFYRQSYDMFDAVVFSCVEGIVKPQREIYEAMLDKLNSSAEKAVFVDDKEICIEGARQAGLNAILFEDFEQARAELVRLGVKI